MGENTDFLMQSIPTFDVLLDTCPAMGNLIKAKLDEKDAKISELELKLKAKDEEFNRYVCSSEFKTRIYDEKMDYYDEKINSLIP